MITSHHDTEQWLPMTQAAKKLGTTQLNVLMHIKRGLLVGVEREDVWWVDPDSLAVLLRKRTEGTLPAVCSGGCAQKAGGCGSCA